MFIGLGTLANVVTVLVGSALGVVLGHRLTERTRTTVTDVLGLVTVVIGGQSVAAFASPALQQAVGPGVGLLVVLFALLLGGLLGSGLRIEERIDGLTAAVVERLSRGADGRRFATGLVTATLVYCVGPLTIVGALADGLGRGPQQLIVKAVLDGFASVAFAASLGWGVAASAVPLLLYQGALTLLGYLLGDVLPAASVDALTATGGVLLLGLGVRLLDVKAVRVADLLPAVLVAPVLVQVIAAVR